MSHLIAIIRTHNGELVEDVVDRQVLDDQEPESPHGAIIDVSPLPEPTVPTPERMQPGALKRD